MADPTASATFGKRAASAATTIQIPIRSLHKSFMVPPPKVNTPAIAGIKLRVTRGYYTMTLEGFC